MTLQELKNTLAKIYMDQAKVVSSDDLESGEPYLTLIIPISAANNTVAKRIEIADELLSKFDPFRGKANIDSLDYEFVVARY